MRTTSVNPCSNVRDTPSCTNLNLPLANTRDTLRKLSPTTSQTVCNVARCRIEFGLNLFDIILVDDIAITLFLFHDSTFKLGTTWFDNREIDAEDGKVGFHRRSESITYVRKLHEYCTRKIYVILLCSIYRTFHYTERSNAHILYETILVFATL